MRVWPWLFSLSLFGCNPIFGLEPTHEQDAATFEAGEGPGVDTPVIRGVEITKLTYDNKDGNSPTTDESALAVDPNVRVALMTDTALSSALPYTNKIVETPREYDNQDWRLVATIDGLTQEWQWRVGDGAHITSTIDARSPTNPTVPATSSIEWGSVPQPTAGALNQVQVTTTGGWMHDRLSTTGAPAATTYDWPVPAGGVAPATMHADVEIMSVLPATPESNHGCYVPKAVGVQTADLVAGSHTSATTTWTTGPTTTWVGPTFVTVGTNRLFGALDGRYVGSDVTWQQGGYVMKGSIPSFNPAPDLLSGRGHVRHPQMLDVLTCTSTNSNAQLDVLAPSSVAELDAKMHKVWYAEITNSRGATTGSMELTSMLQVINVVPSDDTTKTAMLGFTTPLARDIVLDVGSANAVDLQANGSDLQFTMKLGATHRLIPVSWAYETGTSGVAAAPDDVTLIVYGYKKDIFINATPQWVIHVAANHAAIDSDAFANRAQFEGYLLEIVGHTGTDAAKIKSGDYTGATYPLSAASVFTYAFKVQP